MPTKGWVDQEYLLWVEIYGKFNSIKHFPSENPIEDSEDFFTRFTEFFVAVQTLIC